MKEIWKPIPHYDGYEASNKGNVRCWNNQNGCGLKLSEPRKLKLSKFVDNNYLRVGMRNSTSGKYKVRRVHQVVLEAFVGNKPTSKHVVMHKDDDCTNNHLSSLCWATSQQNATDMVNKGRSLRGSKHPKSTLTDEQRKEILDRFALDRSKGSKTAIAEVMGIHRSNMYSILKEVPCEYS